MTGFPEFAAQVMEMTQSGLSTNLQVELYCDDPDELDELARELRDENGIDSGSAGEIEGIFINTSRLFSKNNMFFKACLFELNAGDRVTIYGGMSEEDFPETSISDRKESGSILITGTLEELPFLFNAEPEARMIVLVSEEAFLQLETERPNAYAEPGLHHISLGGMVKNVYELEEICRLTIDSRQNVTGFVSNYDRSLHREKASMEGFRFLCGAFILLLSLVCFSGNFTVSWAVSRDRRQEFATLAQIGMTPGELRKMRGLELLFRMICACVTGSIAGVACYWGIFAIYRTEYGISWKFPLAGFAMGMVVLCASVLVTEACLELCAGRDSYSN